jgi:hypothetical protein
MAMKDGREDSVKKGSKRDTGKLAAQLAPLEEQDKAAARKQGATNDSSQEHGAILVDSPRLPRGILNKEKKSGLGIETVVLVIVGLLLSFIFVIAWLISRMPPQPPNS